MDMAHVLIPTCSIILSQKEHNYFKSTSVRISKFPERKWRVYPSLPRFTNNNKITLSLNIENSNRLASNNGQNKNLSRIEGLRC